MIDIVEYICGYVQEKVLVEILDKTRDYQLSVFILPCVNTGEEIAYSL